ncbi:MAG: hypothetical protein JSU70_05045 [Phycisphaerales bacterium]|nr:MAG: hypothetical protein JSU70_05045 [Phycisphaerales bacterium]
MQTQFFTLRKDQNGYRPVFPLGNTLGRCPHACTFCSVKTGKKVTFEEAVARFEELLASHCREIDGPYHPVIYNRGNVTNPREFPTELLDHVLNTFNADRRVSYVSLNSREQYMTSELLEYLVDKHLSYAIHFIIGIESFSDRAPRVLGKDTAGELDRAIQKLKPFNKEYGRQCTGRDYIFGLDVNLVFLPELYLGPSRRRQQASFGETGLGFEQDLAKLLEAIDPEVPTEINVHPYAKVDALPYDDVDLEVLVRMLPDLAHLVAEHNSALGAYETHLFVGVEGDGYSTERQRCQIHKWKSYIDEFNRAGRCQTL